MVKSASTPIDQADADDARQNLVQEVVVFLRRLAVGPDPVFNLDETSCHVVPLREYGWIHGEVSKDAVGLDSRPPDYSHPCDPVAT